MHITIRRGLTTNLFLFYEVLTSTVGALNYLLACIHVTCVLAYCCTCSFCNVQCS